MRFYAFDILNVLKFYRLDSEEILYERPGAHTFPTLSQFATVSSQNRTWSCYFFPGLSRARRISIRILWIDRNGW